MLRSAATAMLVVLVGCGGDVGLGEHCAEEPVEMDAGVVYVDLECGEGAAAAGGDIATVEYVGELVDGTEFDSSEERGPLTFRIGTGQVIEGWEHGIRGMQVGGRRRLTIPPELAYGSSGMAPFIPPHATLVFEVELVALHDR